MALKIYTLQPFDTQSVRSVDIVNNDGLEALCVTNPSRAIYFVSLLGHVSEREQRTGGEDGARCAW